MKKITVNLLDQNYKSQLNLILFFIQVPPFIYVDSPSIQQEKQRAFQKLRLLLVVRDRSMNPVITKTEHFTIIVNGF